MHILMFSYDKALVTGDAVGDVLLRHQHYAEHLDKLDVLVLAPTKRPPAEINVGEKLTIYPSYGPRILSWLRGYLKARRLCRETRVDIVVAQDALLGVLGVLLRKEFGCKLQINGFGLEIFDDGWLRNSPVHRFYKFVMCWALRKADLVRTDGTKNRVDLIEKLKIHPNKVVTIPVAPGPENISQFASATGDAIREELLGEKYEDMVLFVGMLTKQKNVPNLLRAARLVLHNHPRTLFAIIGDGLERDKLGRLCRELSITEQVRFLGLIPYDKLPEYYAACDVFVLPSWYEGFARVLMEAAFARKPIVATDVSGTGDIVVDNGSGYVVEVNNSQQLADRINWLLENPDKAIRMGVQGYERAASYCDFNRNVEKLITAWRSMLTRDELIEQRVN